VRHPPIRLSTALAALALLLTAPAAGASVEEGDAGDLPATAQDLSTESVDRIEGVLADGSDIDMYRLCVSGGGGFSASAVGGTAVDTQLFLFDADGRGVYANDDDREGVVLQSRLPSGHALTPRVQGEYLLAVGAYNFDPQSANGLIFPDVSGVTGPTGEGGGDPVIGWGGKLPTTGGAYTLFLTGAGCEPDEDTTPPTVDLRSPADGAVVGLGATVVVDFSCDDEGGSGLESCDGTVDNGERLDTSTPGPKSVTVTARDGAGNETSVTHTVTVVEGDATAPLIELLSPLDGAVYLLNEKVPADYRCSDEPGGSGLVSCAGPVADGALVHTASVGQHQFTVAAADAAGNSSMATAAYRVIYDFSGFLWPLRNRPRFNEWPAGAPVPIRFELGGNQRLDVIKEGWPQVAEVGCDFTAEPDRGDPVRKPRWFKQILRGRHSTRFLFLWKTNRSWGGTCRQFMLKLNDGTVKRADFKFRDWRHDHDHGHGHDHGDDEDDEGRASRRRRDRDRGRVRSPRPPLPAGDLRTGSRSRSAAG
jgi:Bacterial Ig domain